MTTLKELADEMNDPDVRYALGDEERAGILAALKGNYILDSLAESRRKSKGQAGFVTWAALAILLALVLCSPVLRANCSELEVRTPLTIGFNLDAAPLHLITDFCFSMGSRVENIGVVDSAVNKNTLLPIPKRFNVGGDDRNCTAGGIYSRQHRGSVLFSATRTHRESRDVQGQIHDPVIDSYIATDSWRATAISPLHSKQNAALASHTVNSAVTKLGWDHVTTTNPSTLGHLIGVCGSLRSNSSILGRLCGNLHFGNSFSEPLGLHGKNNSLPDKSEELKTSHDDQPSRPFDELLIVLSLLFFAACSFVFFFFGGLYLDGKRIFIGASFVFGGLLCVALVGLLGWSLL